MFRFSKLTLIPSILSFLVLFSWNHVANASPTTERVERALTAMHEWVGDKDNGDKWREFLLSKELVKQLSRGAAADETVLAKVLAKYRSSENGLNLPKFIAVRQAIESWRSEVLQWKHNDLSTMARNAKNDYRPIPQHKIDAAQNRLVHSFVQLDQHLTSLGENGEAWKKYLDLNLLSKELSGKEKPNSAKLKAIYRKFRLNHDGLERPKLLRVAEDLQTEMDSLYLAKLKKGDETYAKQMDRLASELAKYLAAPDGDTAANIGQRLKFVEMVGTSQGLVQAVRGRLSRRNVFLSIGTPLINKRLEQPPSRTDSIQDNILGTAITGSAIIHSGLQVQSLPSVGQAHLRFTLSGNASSNTVGANGPVCIYTTGQTNFVATKDIFVTPTSHTVTPATATATTQTTINDIVPQKRFGRKLIRRIAYKKAGQQKGQAEQIASRRAETKISGQFDQQFQEQAGPQFAEMRANYEKGKKPLLRLDIVPTQLTMGSESDRVNVALLEASRSQLGAPTSPPNLARTHDVMLRVHESAPNNVAATVLSGFTITDKWLKKKFIEANKELPPEMQGEDQEPWSITFDSLRPVSLDFSDQSFTVTIRGRRFTSGDKKFGRMNISATYKIVQGPGGILLVRVGKLEILPPRFNRLKDRLSATEAALVKILTKRLDPVFKKEIPTERIDLPGQMGSVGKLLAEEVRSENGWLSIGWRVATSQSPAIVYGQPVYGEPIPDLQPTPTVVYPGSFDSSAIITPSEIYYSP